MLGLTGAVLEVMATVNVISKNIKVQMVNSGEPQETNQMQCEWRERCDRYRARRSRSEWLKRAACLLQLLM